MSDASNSSIMPSDDQLINKLIKSKILDSGLLEEFKQLKREPAWHSVLLLFNNTDQFSNLLKSKNPAEIRLLAGELQRHVLDCSGKDYLVAPGRRLLRVIESELIHQLTEQDVKPTQETEKPKTPERVNPKDALISSLIAKQALDSELLDGFKDLSSEPSWYSILLLLKETDQFANLLKSRNKSEIRLLSGDLISQVLLASQKDYIVKPGKRLVQAIELELLRRVPSEAPYSVRPSDAEKTDETDVPKSRSIYQPPRTTTELLGQYDSREGARAKYLEGLERSRSGLRRFEYDRSRKEYVERVNSENLQSREKIFGLAARIDKLRELDLLNQFKRLLSSSSRTIELCFVSYVWVFIVSFFLSVVIQASIPEFLPPLFGALFLFIWSLANLAKRCANPSCFSGPWWVTVGGVILTFPSVLIAAYFMTAGSGLGASAGKRFVIGFDFPVFTVRSSTKQKPLTNKTQSIPVDLPSQYKSQGCTSYFQRYCVNQHGSVFNYSMYEVGDSGARRLRESVGEVAGHIGKRKYFPVYGVNSMFNPPRFFDTSYISRFEYEGRNLVEYRCLSSGDGCSTPIARNVFPPANKVARMAEIEERNKADIALKEQARKEQARKEQALEQARKEQRERAMCALSRARGSDKGLSFKGLSFSLGGVALPSEVAASLQMSLPEFLKYNRCPSDGSDYYREGSVIVVPFDYPISTVEESHHFDHWLDSK